MTAPAAPATPTTVLVVDDEEGIRVVLARFLGRLGYRTLQAPDVAAALDLQAAEQPAVILSDVRMPEATGVDLVPKALAQDPDVAIILLTAVDEPRTAIECLRLGAYDYLIKPVDFDELEVSLQGALRRRQLERERRDLERWLAEQVAIKTREFEERLEVVEEVALDALRAARDWSGRDAAVQRLARALGVTEAEVARALDGRRG